MSNSTEVDLNQYSIVLADGLKDVAADLRAIDLVDMVSYIRFGSYATIEDLVHSSTELFFRPGTLSFAWSAMTELSWTDAPMITMGMEFRSCAISVFFDLTLRALDESVKVCAVLFEEQVPDPGEKVLRLSEAIAEARLPAPQPLVSLKARRGETP